MDLRQLECFLKVSEHLHFGRAAEELHVSQPTVSEAVRRLERELGAALFERTTRRVTLTPFGADFLEDARTAFEGVRRAYERARVRAEQEALEFNVGYSGDLGEPLLEVVGALQHRFPGVLVNFDFMHTPQQVREVRDGQLHAALGWSPQLDDVLSSLSLGPAHLVVTVPMRHEFAARAGVTLAEIAHEPLIVWARARNPTAYDQLALALDRTGVAWRLAGTAARAENISAQVLSARGIGLGFGWLVGDHPPAGLRYVPLVGRQPDIQRVLFWRTDCSHPALASFLALVEKRVRDLEAAGGNPPPV